MDNSAIMSGSITNCPTQLQDSGYKSYRRVEPLQRSPPSSVSPPYEQYSPTSDLCTTTEHSSNGHPVELAVVGASGLHYRTPSYESRRLSTDSISSSVVSQPHSPTATSFFQRPASSHRSTRPARTLNKTPYARGSPAGSTSSSRKNNETDEELYDRFAVAGFMDYTSSTGDDYSESEYGGEEEDISVAGSNKKKGSKPKLGSSTRKSTSKMEDEDYGNDEGMDEIDERSAEERRMVFEQTAGAFRGAKSNVQRDKARGAFVQAWFKLSYTLNIDGNVCRTGMYGSYLRVCESYGVKSINSASFGKAVRLAFPRIKTRRLGNRGNSRYHYCGIEPSNATEEAILAQIERDVVEGVAPMNSSSVNLGIDDNKDSFIKVDYDSSTDFVESTPVTSRPKATNKSVTNAEPQSRRLPSAPKRPRKAALVISVPPARSVASDEMTAMKITAPLHPVRPARRSTIPNFPTVDVAIRSAGTTVDARSATEFWSHYSNHCSDLLEMMRHARFSEIQVVTIKWWADIGEVFAETIQHPEISNLIYRADAALYDQILELLHARILTPMPAVDFTTLGALAETMESIQTRCLASFNGSSFLGPKIELAARFGHLLVRHLGLCQLGQALTGIVSDPLMMNELATGWESIDFESIKNQSALVSNCSHELLGECFDSFRYFLLHPGRTPPQSLIQWAETIFDRCILAAAGATSPRSLLIRFNFVTSQIIRDLVLRSSPLFGSWQIISLFLDEFLAFQVLRKVALHITGESETTVTNDEVSPAQSSSSRLEEAQPYGSTVSGSTSTQQQPNDPKQLKSNGGAIIRHRSPEFDTQSNHSTSSNVSGFPYLDQFSPSTRNFLENYSENAPALLTAVPRNHVNNHTTSDDSGYQTFDRMMDHHLPPRRNSISTVEPSGLPNNGMVNNNAMSMMDGAAGSYYGLGVSSFDHYDPYEPLPGTGNVRSQQQQQLYHSHHTIHSDQLSPISQLLGPDPRADKLF